MINFSNSYKSKSNTLKKLKDNKRPQWLS